MGKKKLQLQFPKDGLDRFFVQYLRTNMEAREGRKKDKIPETNKMLIIIIFYHNTMAAVVADLWLLQVFTCTCVCSDNNTPC